MERLVEPELLDELPSHDPRAIRSRRDLRRVNAYMGNAGIMARTLKKAFARHLSIRVVELGAGDGEFMLGVAKQLRGRWREPDVMLLDLQDLLKPETRSRFAEMNWRVRSANADVFSWLQDSGEPVEAMVANLFLHHFSNDQLRDLFREAMGRTDLVIAIEPRRAYWPLFCSRLLRFIGCGIVTCHDAPVSVRAGFRDRELSRLWPDAENWELTERPVGWFSHLFIAQRKR